MPSGISATANALSLGDQTIGLVQRGTICWGAWCKSHLLPLRAVVTLMSGGFVQGSASLIRFDRTLGIDNRPSQGSLAARVVPKGSFGRGAALPSLGRRCEIDGLAPSRCKGRRELEA